MLSNKLTFSLASIVFLFALVFMATPVNAQVTIVEVPTNAIPIAANGFDGIDKVGTSDTNALFPDGVISPLLIDLEAFLRTGGTILLVDTRTPTANLAPPMLTPKQLVISEIMWAINEQDFDQQDNDQWIELYNTGADIPAGLAAGDLKLYFVEGDPIPTANAAGGIDADRNPDTSIAPATDGIDGVLIDMMSNIAIGVWRGSVPGQNGYIPGTSPPDETPRRNFVSMYRNIDYDKVETKMDADDEPILLATRLEGVPDGRAAGSWLASTNRFDTGMIGSPGERHFKPTADLAATVVPYTPVIINEIGNGTGDSNDWVEIKNVSTAAVNLKNYSITQVTADASGKASETALVKFPTDQDINLAAGGILLITQSDPSVGTGIAAGKLLGDASGETPADEQENTGTSSLYYISSDLKLADSGASLLVIRSDQAKVNHETIIDLTGTAYIEDSSKDYRTEVFPLLATAKGHANVIDGVADAGEGFIAGAVYKRDDAAGGTGEKDWSKVGFTGVGYDRDAEPTAANGGTPGFPNDAVKTEFVDVDGKAVYTGMVSISEIMVAQTRRNLPQWIELYNNSMTQSVNINGWSLMILNVDSADLDGRDEVTLEITDAPNIAPNQTLLIVSGATSRASDGIGTVYNLFTQHKSDLEVRRKADSVLSEEGFYISLSDARGAMADEVGNILSDYEDGDMTEWDIPTAEEGRSSIIRRHDDGEARDGTDETGWILAENTDLVPETYYGDKDDVGSPAARVGSALPVSLSSFRPMRDPTTGEVVVRWITQSELNNAGFNILRSETKKGEFKVVNLKGIIAGHGTTSEKHVYEWKDTTAKPNVVYYYQIEDVSLDGKRTRLAQTHLRGNVNAAGKATIRWGELKSQR